MTAYRFGSPLALLLLVAGCGQGAAAHEVRPADDAPVRVHTGTAVAHPTPATLDVNGTLAADEQSDLTSIVAGRVMQVFVERGARVNEGDEIVKIRDAD